MKILWLINITPPAVSEQLGLDVRNSGSWIVGLLNDIKTQENINLTVCFSYKKTEDFITGNVDGFDYIGYNDTDDNKERFIKILNQVNPDLIHIWGTEAKHSYDMMMAAYELNLQDKVAVNIQGLISICAKYHYFPGLPKEITHSNRLVELRYGHRIADDQKELLEESKYEVETLKKAVNVIGRTDWDNACTKFYNPNRNYYFCIETLRKAFYENTWKIENCEKHSIFVSPAYWHLKGLHIAVEALVEVKRFYPDAKIYVIAEDPLSWYKSKHYAVRQRSYPRYLAKLICDNNLEDSVIFLPSLSEKEMCDMFLKSNVFVSPSSIENESNSVAEAMILGMPVVSSFVGGVPDYMVHKEEGYFYSSDAPYMLAYYICKIFDDEDAAVRMGQKAREHALKSFDRERNLNTMLEIYNKIVEGKKNEK